MQHNESDWSVDTEFLKFKAAYPQRRGGENWKLVYKSWLRARKQHTIKAIIDGARRYREFLEDDGKIGSQYVQMATTFLNQENWLKSWDAPRKLFVKKPARSVEEKPLPPSADELLRRRQSDPRGTRR